MKTYNCPNCAQAKLVPATFAYGEGLACPVCHADYHLGGVESATKAHIKILRQKIRILQKNLLDKPSKKP